MYLSIVLQLSAATIALGVLWKALAAVTLFSIKQINKINPYITGNLTKLCTKNQPIRNWFYLRLGGFKDEKEAIKHMVKVNSKKDK